MRNDKIMKVSLLQDELIQVEIKGKRGKPSTHVTEDEEFRKVNFEKFSKLGTVFQKDGGTVTAGDNISVFLEAYFQAKMAIPIHNGTLKSFV